MPGPVFAPTLIFCCLFSSTRAGSASGIAAAGSLAFGTTSTTLK